ncbi:MAG: family 20 glycosylhydrolase [Chloroflexi bacterium]|nr:family 20 glycosylhydrolase [Chloroflexota bacterium]MCL5275844.1 family 20 glycosylhydrolase [Chloroflexota bacterium]
MTSKTRSTSVLPSANLLPQPRQIQVSPGTLSLSPGLLIAIAADAPAALFFEAQECQRALSALTNVTWHIHASNALPAENIGLLLSNRNGGSGHAQGYTLDITDSGLSIQGADNAGVFYGVMTLVQLLRQYGSRLPLLHIEDYPDFPARGIMLDVSRDKVPTMKTLFELVDMLAGLKINELQLYTEHTFAYQRHPVVWEHASPLTGEEILQLDGYCKARHINLAPNQNSFGHMRRWLTHDEYRPLAEAPYGCDTRWGHFDEPFTLCPGDSGSIKLVGEMFEDLLPHFTSSMFNVGCDETVDLGAGRSKAECEAKGTSRVYMDFLLKIYDLVKKHGRTMQFWGDIIMEHPELVPELPKDVVALEWGYEFDHPFNDHGAKFAASGVPFYVCPGTSSWNSIGGRTENAIGNLLNAAENGLKHGAIGYLITDWGDNGHHQPLPVSFLGYAYGAAVSWRLDSNRDIDIASAISEHIFMDASGAAGKVVYEIGNVYRLFATRIHNATPYALGTLRPLDQLNVQTSPAELKAALKEIDRLARAVAKLHMHRDDAGLIQREYLFALSLMRYGIQRIALSMAKGKARQSLTVQLRADLRLLVALHRKVWLARNRPGGLPDSIKSIKL